MKLVTFSNVPRTSYLSNNEVYEIQTLAEDTVYFQVVLTSLSGNSNNVSEKVKLLSLINNPRGVC
jgi:hypothetical protein